MYLQVRNYVFSHLGISKDSEHCMTPVELIINCVPDAWIDGWGSHQGRDSKPLLCHGSVWPSHARTPTQSNFLSA